MKVDRFPQSSREELATSALTWCRAVKAVDGVRARFYWTGPNSIGFIVEAPSVHSLDTALGNGDELPPPEVSQAAFAMADLGNVHPAERWGEPQRGEQMYRTAGR
jgi:hypothetical protein